MAEKKASKTFNVKTAFDLNFWRKTVDFACYFYVVLVISLWIGQDIPSLQFKSFGYTSTDTAGTTRDFCSADPLYHINPTIISELYAGAFNNTVGWHVSPNNTLSYGMGVASSTAHWAISHVGVSRTMPLPQHSTNPIVNAVRFKVNKLMLSSNDIYADPPFNLFSVPNRNFCIGPQHYSIAYQMSPPMLSYSQFWHYVKDNRETIYAGYDTSKSISMLLFLYMIPVWVYLVCLLCAKFYMLRKYCLYEQAQSDKSRFEPVILYCLFADITPFILNVTAMVLLICKLSGVCLVHPTDFYWITAFHLSAATLQYYPMALLKYKSDRALATSTSSGTDAAGTATFIQTSVMKPLNVNVNFVPAPQHPKIMALYGYTTAIYLVIIAGLYVSQELAGVTVSELNENCKSYGTKTSNIDSCVDPFGHPYHNVNAHYILALASPVIMLLAWRLFYFIYFCARVQPTGTVARSTKLSGMNADEVDMELQAGIAMITAWRVYYPKPGKDKESTIVEGLRLNYTTLLHAVTTDGNSNVKNQAQMRMLIIGRFLVPIITIITAILLIVIKMSQYALWVDAPWWIISILISCAIILSIGTEATPIMVQQMAARKQPIGELGSVSHV